MLPDHQKPSAWHCCLLALTVLIHGTVLTGCAGMRLQNQARFQPPALNQNADPSWAAVLAVPVRAPLHVELRTGDGIRGRFYSADEQILNLVQRGVIRNVSRADIQRVLLVRGSHAKSGALLGLGIGAGTLAIDVARRSQDYSDFSGIGYLYPAFLFGGIGTAAGALIGRAFPKREVIYEAPVSGAAN